MSRCGMARGSATSTRRYSRGGTSGRPNSTVWSGTNRAAVTGCCSSSSRGGRCASPRSRTGSPPRAGSGGCTELARPGLLVNYDDAYFRNMAERALRAVGSRSGSLHRRLAAAVDAYWAMIEGFCAGRPTLVHGSYRPKNILVDTSPTPLRICPVDWELAAVGPQLHDLACMANEVDHRPTIERFCEAYAE